MTMSASWKLDPYTVMRLNSGRRGDDIVTAVTHVGHELLSTELGHTVLPRKQ